MHFEFPRQSFLSLISIYVYNCFESKVPLLHICFVSLLLAFAAAFQSGLRLAQRRFRPLFICASVSCVSFVKQDGKREGNEKFSQVWENSLYSCHFKRNDQLRAFLIRDTKKRATPYVKTNTGIENGKWILDKNMEHA